MKASLYPLLFGAIMLGIGLFYLSASKDRAAGLTGEDARITVLLRKRFLVQLSVVVGITWVAALVLYLRGI